MNGLDPGLVGTLYRAACLAELDAIKPGNVHAFAPGHRMVVADFVTSAEVSAPPLARPGAGVGERIRDGVAATMAAVGQNTNLGILLLCAPLAAAAERGAGVATVLDTLDRSDAEAAFAAIRMANPGGLGRADRHDVAAAAPESLRDAMAEAAGRDRVARAYGTGFADVTEIGLPALTEARARGLDPSWCTTAVHLAYLRAVPDSHVARKHGRAVAEDLRREVEKSLAGLDLAARPVERLLALDASLKGRGLNPGTSADFTVATLFWEALAAAGATLA
ncbi:MULTISPECIES: triphosphoribosyl-dephospho-CoA synthase [unclassified Methylobacterium]|jgi:triphosphoribosyl-dephospho-CoA synthase|uniref:triphosphoribosyl-dephospho-CoA synthase n=1 Tax=unclassified Methylobacterium TaxID=2615210 RepID=UPI001352A960|nr:triphosphoribosyl-dephospho-CoA synthase [Methylobacterium sp. 2A]MWV23548.1 triphosphoribosyl-dephospho-CoA synthase [Methylobacterium sp. 2A]